MLVWKKAYRKSIGEFYEMRRVAEQYHNDRTCKVLLRIMPKVPSWQALDDLNHFFKITTVSQHKKLQSFGIRVLGFTDAYAHESKIYNIENTLITNGQVRTTNQ